MSKPETSQPRLIREKQTIEAMIRLYCRGHHAAAAGGVCGECRELLDYAMKRLDCCPFGAEKPTCARCPIHCYKPSMRERIREVMRYSGPRMLARHPILALRHQIDSLTQQPPQRKKP